MPRSSCLCGANSISYGTEPILKFRCHCTDERKVTGAAFALNILWSISTLKILSGELSTFSEVADNGYTITNHSCSQCDSLLYRTTTGQPGNMVIKAGCIDGYDAAKEFVPDVEIYTRTRVLWVQPVERAQQNSGDFGTGSGMEEAYMLPEK